MIPPRTANDDAPTRLLRDPDIGIRALVKGVTACLFLLVVAALAVAVVS